LLCFFYFIKNKNTDNKYFIDLELFKNKPFIGAVIANFLLNTGVGVIALFNNYK
jgi:hypothetical protein